MLNTKTRKAIFDFAVGFLMTFIVLLGTDKVRAVLPALYVAGTTTLLQLLRRFTQEK